MNILELLVILFLFFSINGSPIVSTNNNSIDKKIYRLPIKLRDNRGCDALINSCGSKGACCDEHDDCYYDYGCTASSWVTMLFQRDACANCNLRVMKCLALRNPGLSSCCSREDCGQPWK